MNIDNKVVSATKWSAYAEILAKIISPITNILLARLLTPEMFGIVVAVTIVISFVDIFSDAGFQKFIIQHDFEDETKLKQSASIAFTMHLCIALAMCLMICIFKEAIAKYVGCPDHSLEVLVASISLPIMSISSIIIAIFRRNLRYDVLFKVRLLGILTPILITVPLAFFLRSHWALIYGTIASNIITTISLIAYSEWRPTFLFEWISFRNMFSFSFWSLMESILTWLTSYIDIMLLVNILSPHHIGIYRTAMMTANQILSILTATTTTVLFSSLSRLQNDETELKRVFFSYQRLAAYIAIPLGCGMFLYKDLITSLLLGTQWIEAAGFIGIWGLVGGIYLVTGGYCSEMYRAVGQPNVSALVQFLYIIIIICLFNGINDKAFSSIYTIRTFSRILFISIHFIMIRYITKISLSPGKMLKNITVPMIGSLGMFLFYYLIFARLNIQGNFTWEIISIIGCATVYVITIAIHPSGRENLKCIVEKFARIRK